MDGGTFCDISEACLRKLKSILNKKQTRKDQTKDKTTEPNNSETSNKNNPLSSVSAKTKTKVGLASIIDNKVEVSNSKHVVHRTLSSILSDYKQSLENSEIPIGSFLEKSDYVREIFCGNEFVKTDDINAIVDPGAKLLNNASDFVTLLFSDYHQPLEEFKLDEKLILNITKPILEPVKLFSYSEFGMNVTLNLALNPKRRYLPNWDVQHIKSLLKEIESKNSRIELDKDLKYRILKGVYLMFLKLSNQHRFGTFESHILSCFQMKQKLPSEKYYVNLPNVIKKTNTRLRGIDTVCWQFLSVIVRHYNGIPFYIKKFSEKANQSLDDTIFLTTDKPISCSLPGVLHALINGILSEILGDLNHETALIYVNHVFYCASISIYQSQLDYKSKMRTWVKLAFNKMEKVLVNKHTDEMRWYDQKVEDIGGEFWTNQDEKKNLEKNVKVLPKYFSKFVTDSLSRIDKLNTNTRDLITDLKSKIEHSIITSCEADVIYKTHCAKNTEFLRWLVITNSIISNFSLYNKTSLLLEYDKSVGTKLIRGIEKPNPLITLLTPFGYEIPLTFDWSSNKTLKDLSFIFDTTWKEVLIPEFDDISDFEKKFVTYLTNKSGGIKTDEPTLSKALRGISNARIIAFVLDRDKYDQEIEFMKMLLHDGKCAIRFQIDRRARIIVIVPNAVQTNELFILLAFNMLKKHKELGCRMAVGKQVGNILDARLQVIYSGRIKDLKNSGDMSGMDAHTVPNITQFLRYKVIEMMMCLRRKDFHGVSKYFFSEDKEYTINDMSNEFEMRKSVFLRGIVVHSAKVMNSLYSMNMELEDGFFGKSMFVSDQTFQSGFFGTSAQHTMLIDLVILSCLTKFYQMSNENKKIKLVHSIMGDDVFEIIINGSESREIVNDWLRLRNDTFLNLNYELEEDISKVYCVFLQQAALLGSYVPFPARISVFCDERSETSRRHPLDVIQIILNVLTARAQRSYCIDNSVSVGYAIWNAHRTSKYRSSSSNKLCEKLISKKELGDLLVKDFNGYRMTYPLLLISVRPISWPLLSFKVNTYGKGELIYKSKSVTSLNGDVNTILINQMFYVSDDLHMFNISDALKSNELKVKLTNEFINWDERHKYGFTLSEHLLEFKRLRRLTETRKEELGYGAMELMVNNLNKYLNSKMVVASTEAVNKLEVRGVKVPTGLMYINHNRTKIEQSLTVRSESLEERDIIDDMFIEHILKYKIAPTDIDIIRTHALCAVRMRIYEQSQNDDNSESNKYAIKSSQDGIFNSIMPILPGYHINSCYSKLIRYTSLPEILDRNITGVIGEITGSLGASFDVEAAVAFGAYVYTFDKDLVNEAGVAIGIPDKLLNKFIALVENYLENNFNVKYHSIFNTVKYFAINGSITKYGKHADYSTNLLRFEHIRGLQKFNDIFARDLIFGYVDELNDRKIRIEYSIYSLLVIMSRGALKYFSSHVDKIFNPLLNFELESDPMFSSG